MITWTQPIPIADAIAKLNDARDRLRRALTNAEQASAVGTPEQVRHHLELAAELGREASTNLSAILGRSSLPDSVGHRTPNLARLCCRPDSTPPSVYALVALLDSSHPPGGLPWTNGARAMLALEVLRTCDHVDPAVMAPALDSIAAIVRAEIERTP